MIALTGLDREATLALLGSATTRAHVERVHRQTAGNPLFITQLAHAAGGPDMVRAGLDDAIAEHIAAVSADVSAVLELAAVAGTRFDLRVVTAAAAVPPLGRTPAQVSQALAAAEATGLVTRDSGEELGFVHALIRDHLYSRVDAGTRAQLHAALADVLPRVYVAGGLPVDLLAHHYYRAWPERAASIAARAQRTAGDHAAAALDFAKAGEFYRRGLDLVAMEQGFDDHEFHADLLAATGEAALASGDLDSARAAYAAMTHLAGEHGLLRVRVRASLGTVYTFATERSDDDALDCLTAALRDALGSVAGAIRWQELLAEGIAAVLRYRPVEGRAVLDEALARHPEASGRLLSAGWEQQHPAAQLTTARALVADASADQLGASVRLWASEVATGQRALADRPATSAGRGADSSGSRQARWELMLWRITVATATGRLTRADRLISAAQERLDRIGVPALAVARSASLRVQRAYLGLLRGDSGAFVSGLEGSSSFWSRRHSISPAIEGYLAALAGQQEAAHAVCDTLVDEIEDGELPAGDYAARLVMLGEACVSTRHRRGIEACRQALQRHAGEHVLLYLTVYLGAVEHHLGRLAAASGDFDGAAELLDRALAAHNRTGAAVLAAQSEYNLACVRWRRGGPGDRDAAVVLRDRAMASARRLGLVALASRPWPPHVAA